MRLWWLLGAVALGACDDDKASPPPVSSAPTASAAAEKRVRLVYEPGSPLETARVAARLRKRLGENGVEIANETISVDVPAAKLASIKETLGRGRLDLHVFDDKADIGEVEAPLAVRKETVRGEVEFVVGPERAALVRQFEDARVLTGPLFEGAAKPKLFRAYPVLSSSVRGEHVARASVRQQGNTTMLDVAFDGAGKSFVRWGSKEGVRFVLLVDGDVLSTVSPEGEIEDGQLAFPFESRSDLASTLKAARATAEALHGVALSHAVKLAKEQPLE